MFNWYTFVFLKQITTELLRKHNKLMFWYVCYAYIKTGNKIKLSEIDLHDAVSITIETHFISGMKHNNDHFQVIS